jgi:triacylglycerol lipase
MKDKISLRYPVLFVHGAGFRDKTLGINYWGRIPKYLSNYGIIMYYGGTDAWGSIEKNAEILKNTIQTIIKKNKVEKVNIIAHSRGGLEVRYLISALQMDYAIASLTTISTPHRGVKIMNIAYKAPVGLYRFISFFVNTLVKIAGDKYPDFFNSSRELSEKYCTNFNNKYPNHKNIYYQSYAAKLKYFFSDIRFILLYLIISLTDGDNDGLCPVESAKWGNFQGIITAQGLWGISHAGIIDASRIEYKGVDILALYLEIVEALFKKGF